MKFSTFQIMHLPAGESCTGVIHGTLEQIVASEALGYANVWLSEHHGSPYCISVAPSALAAAVAMRTERLGIGYAVNILPLSHPLKLAEELSSVDQLCKGRLIAGFGSGNQAGEFGMFGLDFEHRKAMAREALDTIKRLWADEVVSAEGRYFSLRDAKLVIRPHQKPHPPICVAVGSAEGAAAMGGQRFGINLAGPHAALPEKIQAYRAACPPGFAGHVGYLRNIYVRQGSIDGHRVRRAVDVFGKLLSGSAELTADQVDFFRDALGFYGPPPAMVAHMRDLEEMGIDEVLCSFKWGDLSFQEAQTSMETFAALVSPHFSAARSQR